MKFAVLALVLGLCVAVASAGILTPKEYEDVIEFTPVGYAHESGIDEESLSVFGSLFFAIRASLSTLRAVNCSIKRVLSIQSAGVDFLNSFKSCNVDAVKPLNALAKQVQTVVNTCNDIIHVNTNICHNGALNDKADGKKTTPLKCFFKLFFKTLSLKGQITKVITLSKKLPSGPKAYGSCVTTSVNNLVSVFTEFPTFVKTCAKLGN